MVRSVRVGGKNPKSVWWNDDIKAAVRRKMYGSIQRRERLKGVYIGGKRK